jgi:hypothetical protein
VAREGGPRPLTGDVIAIASAIEDGAYFKGSAAFPGDCFRRGNGKRKIDNVSDGIQAEDTGCFLDFLQIFLQDGTMKGTPLESFPFRGIQTGADFRWCATSRAAVV